ncbi:MAG: SPFH/Band 7/PHB domain protein [Candidatus Micrarchaeota archaeon]|jgi:regulator of protease activity HflC (stomatin/prohibitin superfamily)|nr:SPFH/Band 7/PHB domain protein [Candidatus Micrarchaeota archaeon]
MDEIITIILVIIAAIALFLTVRIIPQTHRGLVERFGRYKRYCEPGITFVIPLVDQVRYVNITEQMFNAEPQVVITKDSLNATIDAQVYFKVKNDEESVKKSQYAVNDYESQITALARTTLRSIMGGMNLDEANSQRQKLNEMLGDTLKKEATNWGIDIVRTELTEISPPPEVQTTMNEVVIAQKKKTAAIDFATATETEADGKKRAIIKVAEGDRQGTILRAEGEAAAIKLVNEASNKTFIGPAVEFKRLETAREVLANNTKIIVPEGSNLVNVIGEALGNQIIPISQKKASSNMPKNN